MIPTLTAYAKTQSFCSDLESHRPQLERLISRHLGISTSEFVLLGREHWVWGSFNICLPIDIKCMLYTRTLPRQAILRFPLPFRCGEEFSPGNVEEKLRCEAATYIWLQRYCPSIPTPRLLAVGFPGAESVCTRSIREMERSNPRLERSVQPSRTSHFGIASSGECGAATCGSAATIFRASLNTVEKKTFLASATYCLNT